MIVAVPTKVGVWLLAARPKTLPAAVAPVLVGTAVAVAEGAAVPWVAAAALAVAVLLQIGANLANDVFDFRRGADTSARLGPVRVTQSGLIPTGQVLVATGVVLGASVVAGLPLVIRGGWPILLLGLLAILAALAYTAGPVPLGYYGLGEVAVFVFFGPVAVAGTYYLQSRDLSALAVTASIPVGCLATAILVINNLRDIPTDKLAGKRTLAVRLGPRKTRIEYGALLGVAFLTMPVLWLADLLSTWWWLPWLTVPLAASLVRRVASENGQALNPRLAETARLHLLFGLLFVGSILG
ncbi:MAG: 1,4-dihydroxy-2-naphthoate polyprenyltransferase [Thermomicrobiales bacterium]|nr:1,4-dihydroxy-2-naphthoate polyprenyltransferase [Thermomicrobiales bacterium]